MLRNQQSEDARIEKKDGSTVGPYKAIFSSETIIILDEKADVEEGDVILRSLPSGRDERSQITRATFYPSGAKRRLAAHYQVKFRKGESTEYRKLPPTININGAQSVQVGDYNTQNIVNSFEALVKKIESSNVSPEEKQEAKGILQTLLAHPAVVAVLGAAAGAVL